jgi:glycosyltransferase involved in cell wall biosynthesis
MTRVLHVITRVDRGGSEQRLRDVIRSVPADHDVVVGRASDPEQVARIADDAQVFWNRSLVREVDPLGDARAFRRILGRARAGRYDVVHTHQAKGGILGRFAAALARVPVVYHSASMASFGPGYGRWESGGFALAEWATAPLVRRYFVVGRDLAERLRHIGIADRRLEIVRSSLDLTAFTPPSPGDRALARKRFGFDSDVPILCYVGSLDPRKGVMSLPAIVQHVRSRSDRRATLVIAGDGPQRGELALALASLGQGDRLLGHTPHVADLMHAADAIVLPSSAEGVPQVLVQAMASGLPFAAYDVDGVGELRDLGAVGRRVKLGDVQALAAACVDVLGSSDRGDPPSPAILAQWTLDEVGRRYRAAYERDAADDVRR